MANRESHSEELELVTDPIEKARMESENALRQTNEGMLIVARWLHSEKFVLKPSLFMKLHGILLRNISSSAGSYRAGPMRITNSKHAPPPQDEVAHLMELLCDYVNENWYHKTSVHLCAYVLWRLNWVHPFADGNGRTARIVSYMILCAHAKTELPGTPTIPEQIARNKSEYYAALEKADSYYRSGQINLSHMEHLLEQYLAIQLVGFYETLGGRLGQDNPDLNKEIQQAVEYAKSEGVLGGKKGYNQFLDIIEKRPVLYTTIAGFIIACIGWLFAN
jgi:Fic family protein